MKSIIEKKVRWPEMDKLDPQGYQINQWIDRLDNLNVEYEARWGVGVLPKLVSPETSEKWHRHIEKLDSAIEEKDVYNVRELIEGAFRGYDAMEKEAMTAGFKPHGAPVAWTVRMSDGRELAICATRNDAGVLHGNCRDRIPLVIYTLEEIAGLVAAREKIYTG